MLKKEKKEEERIARLNSSRDKEKEEIVSLNITSNKRRAIPSSERKIVEAIRRNRDSITIEELERLNEERLKDLYELKGGGVRLSRRSPIVKSARVQDEKLNKSKGIDRDLEL